MRLLIWIRLLLEGEGRKLQSTEQNLVHFLKNFISTLIAVPGHPENGAFYLLNGLKKVIDEYPWYIFPLYVE